MSGKQGIFDSKFRLILVAAKRARQVQGGAKPLVLTQARKPTRVAQDELRAGVLPYEIIASVAPDASVESSEESVGE
ncbi:MAG: DNA-directed RNA polymerase subunit omega [Acidobacteria bacterium]|nr:DNA-directed RNA polymerase subunit omega [Acidobacteriota bacterium]